MDIQTPTDAVMGKMNILSGTRSDLVVTPQFAVVAPTVTITAAQYTAAAADAPGATAANANINAAVMLH